MGKRFEHLTKQHIDFIQRQKLYFVATAGPQGSVNVSPKGGDSLRVLDANTLIWLNLTGSGNESAGHVQLDPRMTVMFCAFEGPPMILRTYGKATALHRGDAQWQEYVDLFPASVASRQIFVQHIETVQTSCGMSVPYFDYVADRDDLAKWSDKQGPDGIERYWINRNQQTIDGFDTDIVARSGLQEPTD
ncbi:pyridoxamine 5'-phosphate oxidase family protein [Aestuariibacter halophilus]|uniref:Pyridoxamine 5'-phosphate oxidase family protein n=1 Tax=Fluctibacter halophilus TaxID=226011 RepID=A0ABS8G7V5_9ALTE|nr:pyridoxamine 5'-phosphate oxidase family protein [Aestuariibacter halophilus]MCC2616549.1 pyridoxamine 5'-phosphate oxidase family protein [Aestuariibacter halophilus]